MRGWTVTGDQVILTGPQEQAVRSLLEWGEGHPVTLLSWPEGAGKTTVLATVIRYERARADTYPLPDDPRRAPLR